MLEAKDVLFGDESRKKLLNGVNIIANAVRTTLGPKGRTVIIQQGLKPPYVTKDGVTVAKEIMLKDAVENMGCQMVLEAAENTAKKAGDGTTTATVLSQSIIVEGMKLVASGMNPMDIKRGIDIAVEAIIEQLDSIAVPCKDDETVKQIASLSANSDKKIGDIIAEALISVGKNGSVTIEKGRLPEDELTIVQGMRIDRGFISNYFVTDENTQTVSLENCYILLYDEKISDPGDLIGILTEVSKTGKSILIVAEDVEDAALETLLMNNFNKTLRCCAICAPGLADRRLPILEDMAILTGGKVFSKELIRPLKDAKIEDLGVATKIHVDHLYTTIVDGHGDEKAVEDRITAIRSQIELASNDHNKNKLVERLTSLAGGVALIRVGGSNNVEKGEKIDRYDDSLNATKAAIEDGIVPGGGVALIRAKQKLGVIKAKNNDQQAGIDMVLTAVESPLRQIVSNAGSSPDVVVNEITKNEGKFGYDAGNEIYGDMFDFGIIDPVQVTKTALKNAGSVAGLIITSECSITKISDSDYHKGENQSNPFGDDF